MAMRRGAHVFPKYLFGKPTDETNTPGLTRLPLSVQRFFFRLSLRTAQGPMTAYGLPEPDHKMLEAHPTISSDLLPRLGHGDITVKPNIDRFEEGQRVALRRRQSARRSTSSCTARATRSPSRSSTRRSSPRTTTA